VYRGFGRLALQLHTSGVPARFESDVAMPLHFDHIHGDLVGQSGGQRFLVEVGDFFPPCDRLAVREVLDDNFKNFIRGTPTFLGRRGLMDRERHDSEKRTDRSTEI